MSEKTSIIIIGGGAAGVGTAKVLDTKLNPQQHSVTLITEFDYLRHHPAALRAVVTSEGELEKQICLPYDLVFGKDKKSGAGRLSSIKIAKVSSVEETDDGGFVHLEGGERLHWDYLVVATGSEWNGPLRWPALREDVSPYLDTWREKFASAKSIVVVGAGAVGSELAGEIRDFHPSAELTVVQKDRLPLNATYPDALRQRIATELNARSVRVILDDTVQLSQAVLDGTDSVTPGRKITTARGTTIPAEFIVATAGRRGVNTSFLTAANSPSAPGISGSLNAAGFIETTNTLQLKKNPRVFAGGDVLAFPEQHTLIKAGAHAPLIAGNIITLIAAGENKGKGKLTEYVKPTDSILITNGRTRGSLYVDLFTFFGRPVILGNWISATLKSKTLLVGVAKGLVNQS
jgi:NADH dehydrogenase FAD-containing subunit